MDQVRRPILTPKSTCPDISMFSDAQLLKVGGQEIKHGGDYELATKIYLKVADKGDDTDNNSSAASKTIQLWLKNPACNVQIFTLCMDASDRGSRSAAHIISECYEFGSQFGYPVDRNASQQISYMKRAAELDHPEALSFLSQRYEGGIGVEQDLLIAAECLERLRYLYEHGLGVRPSLARANSYSREATSLREQAHLDQTLTQS